MRAVFLDGWSLKEQQAQVELGSDALSIRSPDGAQLRVWSLNELQVEALHEGGVYHVSHASAPHEQLLLRDEELGRALSERAGGRVGRLPGGDKKLQYGLLGLLGLVLLMVGLYKAVPPFTRVLARHIPLEHERALGSQMELLLSFDKCESPESERLLRGLLRKLSPGRKLDYEVRVISTSMPNAFALPGGLILVTRGFLREAESGDEIAGVLAHEVEHVVQRHVLAGALRDTLLTALWSLTIGDYSGLMVVDPMTGSRIANLEFTREDEQAADDGAVARLHDAGFSHRGLISFFERIQKEDGPDGESSLLSSHPSTEARLQALRKQTDVTSRREPLSDDDLSVLQNVSCK
jgi:Zn-dependent protease with chaperone function